MRADRGIERTGARQRRPRRRWATVGCAAVVVGGIGLLASSCTGPVKPQEKTLAVSCTRRDANGKLITTYSTNSVVGVSMPTYVHKGDKASIQDATLTAPTHADDWIVLQVTMVNGSPSTLQWVRSPGDDRFNAVQDVNVVGTAGTNLSARLKTLFVVHPKDGSYVYDSCKPTASVPTFAYSPIK